MHSLGNINCLFQTRLSLYLIGCHVSGVNESTFLKNDPHNLMLVIFSLLLIIISIYHAKIR